MAATPFPRDEHLTSIAIAYKNLEESLIADAVLPRVSVGKRTFVWFEYPLADSMRVPNTRVGERSQVPQIEIRGEKRTGTVEDFGIGIPLTHNDVTEAPKEVNPREQAVEEATNIVLLDREVRVARMVFDPARYDAANRVNLTEGANTPWSDYEDSDPIKDILTAFDECVVRPNMFTLGQSVWTILRQHPKVVSACQANSGTSGVVSRAAFAEKLEVNEVLVGSAHLNISKPGETPTLNRAWGNHALGFYRNSMATTSRGVTFGYTVQHGERVAGAKEVDMGLHGGTLVRSGESVRELIVAPKAAFFFQNAIA